MRKFIIVLANLVFLIPLLYGGQEEGDRILRLNIGKEGLRDKTMEVTAGEVYSAREGRAVPLAKMIDEMHKARFIYVGETHDSLPMHDVQLSIIEALYARDKDLCIGVEMFPVTLQESLNKWNLGILSEEEFIRETQWYVNWNFNFGFYEKIFDFAKINRLPVYALNVPRSLISKVRMMDWEALTEKEKGLAPEPDLTHKDHRTLIRAVFESTELPHAMAGPGLDKVFEGLYRAQSTWDEAMAHYALVTAKKENRRMVVLAGSGHLLYNLGINRRAFEKSRLPFKTIVCVTIPQGKGSVPVSRNLADYVWGLSEEERPAFPSVGLAFKTFDGLENLVIQRDPIDGVAKGQDFKKGDVVLSVDGNTYSDINELRIYLSRFIWGEEVRFLLLRDAGEKDVILKFELPEESEAL